MMFNFEPVAQAESLKRYTAKTFGWMFLGLAVTFGVMMATYYSGAVFFMMSTPVLFILALLNWARSSCFRHVWGKCRSALRAPCSSSMRS